MIRIIINADDLGKDHETNLAIEKALKEGSITSSTIMANSNTWDDVHSIINDNPAASFGIHLNLTEGPALSKSNILFEAGIVDEKNFFTKKAKSLSSLNTSVKEAIFNEWDNQISKIINKEKINVSHLDGHHHIHMNPIYVSILKDLSQKYNIKYIRRKHNTWCPKSFKDKVTSSILSLYVSIPLLEIISCKVSKRFKNRILNHKWIPYLNEVVGFTDFFNGYEQALELIKNGFYPPQDAIIELMCHPGHPSFAKEYELVNNHTIEKLMPNSKLFSYNNIKE